jgi:hypothetical protein
VRELKPIASATVAITSGSTPFWPALVGLAANASVLVTSRDKNEHRDAGLNHEIAVILADGYVASQRLSGRLHTMTRFSSNA